MNLQPTLENEIIRLVPLQETDFETLFAAAADPLVWEQHPNKDRYKREVFEKFFEGAMASKGAFKVIDSKTGNVIGSTRFYDYDPGTGTILIGYSFLAKNYWGGIYNPAMKKLMMDYAFQFVDHVQFHIGANNIRSQMAIQRLGAKKVGELDLAYYGEQKNRNFIFQIDKVN
ncbi:MAG: GNAT family N-acetyltransferase [Bacteroidetes bacterium]|nr:GNAT family N-acetyltransferase [Bacteroidota bacterium]